MKTARRGISHKTEHQGVHLDLVDAAAVSAAWQDLACRLGPEVLLAPMVTAQGLELVLGMVRDEQFGPLVMLGFGGVRLEALKDVVYALPPFDADTARWMLMRLKQAPLFSFDRGEGLPDVDSFCRAGRTFLLGSGIIRG